MQDNVVMAFRKRLKKRGYTDISIKYNKKKDIYNIKAIEPLGHLCICVDYSITAMYDSFRF